MKGPCNTRKKANSVPSPEFVKVVPFICLNRYYVFCFVFQIQFKYRHVELSGSKESLMVLHCIVWSPEMSHPVHHISPKVHFSCQVPILPVNVIYS